MWVVSIDFVDPALRFLVFSSEALSNQWGALAAEVRLMIGSCINASHLSDLLALGFVVLMTPVAHLQASELRLAVRSVTISVLGLRGDGSVHPAPRDVPEEVYGLRVLDLAVDGRSYASAAG